MKNPKDFGSASSLDFEPQDESRVDMMKRNWRCFAAAAVGAISIIVVVVLLIWSGGAGLTGPCHENAHKGSWLNQAIIMMIFLFVTCGASLLLHGSYTEYLLRVAIYILLVWFNTFLMMSWLMAECVDGADDNKRAKILSLFTLATGGTYFTYLLWFVTGRAVVLGRALHKNKSAIFLRWLVAPVVCTLVAAVMGAGLQLMKEVQSVIFWLFISEVMLGLAVSLRPLLRTQLLAGRALDMVLEDAGDDADASICIEEITRSRRANMSLFIGATMSITLAVLAVMARATQLGVLLPITMDLLGLTEDALMNAFLWIQFFERVVSVLSACFYSGVFSGSLSANRSEWENRCDLRTKRRAAIARYRPCVDEQWQTKVEDLAHRGFTIGALLEFYRKLGTQHMPHFDGNRSTTLDVVRHVIIPQSSSDQNSLAAVLMHGRTVRPDKMVTHNWSNRFRDLVACIVADELDEDEYCRVAYLLDHNMDLLEEWLRDIKALDRSCWVCAFSISQHDGICGGNPYGDLDSVTKTPHPVCNCGKPKAFNTTAPLRQDGMSIPCEMNKFDDMLEYLGCMNPDFRHVVVVDFEMTMFSRAWCVAEIAKAFEIGIHQHVVVHSSKRLQDNLDSLNNLRVQDMKATRPEDVEAILAKITDKEEFNRRLHELIHDRLLTSWGHLDEGQQMRRVGQVALWQLASQQLKVGPEIWRCCYRGAKSAKE